MRFFNTTGPCVPTEHYALPSLPRLGGVDELIDKKLFFVLHAPRQSGKTTYLNALTRAINSGGQFFALNCSLSSLRGIHDANEAMEEVVDQISVALKYSEVDPLKKLAFAFDSEPYMAKAGLKVRRVLSDLCQALDRELVVFFDEADCLHDAPLIRFLTQIRDGYLYRHSPSGDRFPRSIALVGMRDIRDYMSRVRPDEMSIGAASPFNVKKESLTLANFTKEEISALYGQHTAETGQAFAPAAIDR
ncbi:MAG: ATP-binding protein, partial [Deltaproteobacteria bacterium]|nr:ATP-binding protein [Deltaproteobacteria bacterium]